MTAETFSGKAGSGARCYGYDQRGQLNLSGLEVNADGQDLTQTMNFAYNDAGQITGLVYPDGEAVTSQYDNNGYFRSAYFGTATNTDPVTFLVGQTSYTNQGQLSSLALGGSAAKTGTPSAVVNTAFTYDGIQRPLSSSASTSAGTIWSQARTYDNVGNVLSVNTTLPTTTGGSQSEMQSFCYDALNRLVWAGDTGTPTGGDHCGLNPTGTTISTYQQSFSYDALDRLTNGPSGKETYGTFPTHGANTLGSVPNQYASYDAMGNMTCRNVDTTSAHSCDSSQTGALMTYDNEGRLETWTAPSGTTANAQYLYDTAGNRVFAHTSSTVGGTATTVDTMTFDGYTDVTTTNGTVSTTKYYMAGGQRVALKKDGVLSYLLPDLLGSTNIALNSDGSVQAVQLFSPFGSTRYSDGTMPTPYNFTGQRLDSLTGLLYYNARYYDPASGRFISADSVIDNSSGNDPYAYVTGNPETFTDPTGHYEPRGLDGGDESTIGFGPGAFDNGDSFGNDEGGSGGSSGDFNLDGSGGGSSGDFNSDGGSGGGSSGDFNSPGGDSNNGGTGSSGGGDAQNGTSGNSGDAQNGTSGNSGDAQSVSVGNGTSNSATEDTNSNVNEQTNVQQIQKIRADNNVGARRNIATINYSIGGESDQAWASSGPDFNGSVPKPTNPVFDNTPTANGNLRDADSEFKLLNYIAQRFNPSNAFTSDIGGSAELYTELPPCLSCSNVIGQFRSMFPNIDLTVIYGPANTIWWGP
jgi:RHS repeat-associated protein